MPKREEFLTRIMGIVKDFPKQPYESDWEDLKKSLDNIQQRLAPMGEYVANNFYEAIEFVPYTEGRLKYVLEIEDVGKNSALPVAEKEELLEGVVLEYEGYLARALLYLGWTVGWCPQTGSFLLSEEVTENVCGRCSVCLAETPEIEWRHPIEVPPEMG